MFDRATPDRKEMDLAMIPATPLEGKHGALRAAAEVVSVAVCTVAFAATALSILGSMLGPNSAGTHDFVEYWAAGRLFAHGANPYDPAAIQRLERSVGFPLEAPTLIMGNPPSALLLVLPLGALSATVGEWVWLLLLLASLAVSVETVRSLYRLPSGPLYLLAYAFAPVLACLLAGQIALFLLLGLVLFLRWNRRRPFLAGASLWLCLLKPHLFVPMGVVLLLWIVRTRSYRLLAGTAAALGLSSAVATAMQPHIWTQYAAMMREQRIDRVALPSLSTALRLYVPPHSLWLQCLPAAVGGLWAILFYWKRRSDWDWASHASVMMLVSVLVAPYSWFMDQSLLVPAILEGAKATRFRLLIALLALMSAGIQIAALRGVVLLSPFYLWTAPGWLLWYVLARVRQSSNSEENGLNRLRKKSRFGGDRR